MTDQQPVLAVTEKALEKVRGFRAQSQDPDTQAMWVEVSGSVAGEYTYDIALKAHGGAGPEDEVTEHGDLAVVVPAASIDQLRGATVDWIEDPSQAGFTLRNPNKPAAPQELPMLGGGVGEVGAPASPPIPTAPQGDLSGPVAQRVLTVLEEQVNPAIAMHGGVAELVAVEDEVAYLRLGGGCQGCGMASVTLNQGIEIAIKEAVPEIERIVDVTDHASGANPYFEQAKK